MKIGQRRTRIRDLAPLPLVLVQVEYCLRKMVEAECAKAGVHPQVVIEMSSPDDILQAVADGTGATILRELYVRSRLSGGECTTLPPRHKVGLAYLTKRYRSLAAEEFARLCQLTMKELQPDPEQPVATKIRAPKAG